MKKTFERFVMWASKGMPSSIECWMHSWVHTQNAFMNGARPPHVDCQCGKTWEDID